MSGFYAPRTCQPINKCNIVTCFNLKEQPSKLSWIRILLVIWNLDVRDFFCLAHTDSFIIEMLCFIYLNSDLIN